MWAQLLTLLVLFPGGLPWRRGLIFHDSDAALGASRLLSVWLDVWCILRVARTWCGQPWGCCAT